MHETAVAQSILDTILQQAEKLNAKPIRALISCGQFNALNDEVMQFAFRTAAEGTICQSILLEIKHIPLHGKCLGCGKVFEFDISAPVCPACKTEHFDFEPDAPLLLEEIEFEETKDPI